MIDAALRLLLAPLLSSLGQWLFIGFLAIARHGLPDVGHPQNFAASLFVHAISQSAAFSILAAFKGTFHAVTPR